MKIIQLDASGWRSQDDFFDAVLPALGAPDWHGRNLDALWDSVASDQINSVHSPYEICVIGADGLEPNLHGYIRRFVELVNQARGERGVEVIATVRL